MTKRNLLLVSLFLVFGLVAMATSAVAQVSFQVGWGKNAAGRHEGLTEETGVVTLTQNNAAGGYVAAGNSFDIVYSAAITSVASVYLQCSSSLAGSPYGLVTTACPTSGAGGLIATLPGPAPHLFVRITFTGPANTFFPSIFVSTSIIQVTVRVNASVAPCGQWVTAYGSANSIQPYSLSVTNPAITNNVLFVNCEPNLSLSFGTEKGKLDEAATVLTCIGVKDELGNYDADFTLNVGEVFANALTSASYEYASDPVGVTNGTSFTVTFYNVPVGMGITNTDVKPCSTLWTGNPLYCAGGTLDVVEEAGQPVTTSDTGSSPATDTVRFTFDVKHEGAGFPESVDLKFKFWSHGQLPPGLYQMTANVSKGPIDAPAIPRFVSISELPTLPGLPGYGGLSVVEFSDCKTFLLYPYVTDQYGWDAGIAVSNTTLDPYGPGQPLHGDPAFGMGSAVPQSGPCHFYVYANNALAALVNIPTLLPGSTAAWGPLSSHAPGISGYIFAICDFQNAHGYAIITYALLGDNGIGADYLADILPNIQWYHRSPAGNGLGETAIAPYWINKELRKLLNFGSTGCCH